MKILSVRIDKTNTTAFVLRDSYPEPRPLVFDDGRNLLPHAVRILDKGN